MATTAATTATTREQHKLPPNRTKDTWPLVFHPPSAVLLCALDLPFVQHAMSNVQMDVHKVHQLDSTCNTIARPFNVSKKPAKPLALATGYWLLV